MAHGQRSGTSLHWLRQSPVLRPQTGRWPPTIPPLRSEKAVRFPQFPPRQDLLGHIGGRDQDTGYPLVSLTSGLIGQIHVDCLESTLTNHIDGHLGGNIRLARVNDCLEPLVEPLPGQFGQSFQQWLIHNLPDDQPDQMTIEGVGHPEREVLGTDDGNGRRVILQRKPVPAAAFGPLFDAPVLPWWFRYRLQIPPRWLLCRRRPG